MPMGMCGGGCRTLVADWSIWPHDRLLHVRPFELREQRARYREPGGRVLVIQLEAELLSVVADVLHALQQQADEALVATCESLNGRNTSTCACLGRDVLLLVLARGHAMCARLIFGAMLGCCGVARVEVVVPPA